MIITITLSILVILTLFSLILGQNFIGATTNVIVDNIALVNGSTTTFFVEGQDVLFQVDTSVLLNAGIALIVAIIVVATITGIQVLGSGLNANSAKIIILITGYIGIWTSLSIVAFNLITSIEIFGSIIYISITIAYSIGVLQNISGGN